jgi:hypothetical protein
LGADPDFGFVLGHLALKYPNYTKFYNDSFSELILDNSRFELGVPVPSQDMFRIAQQLLEKPKILYISTPDVYGSSTKTYNECLKFLEAYFNHEVSRTSGLMFTIHGSSRSELRLCAEMLLETALHGRVKNWIIGIPYIFPYVEESDHKETQRASFIGDLIRMVSPNSIHLLGCANPKHIPFYRNVGIRSMDTTFPIMAAIQGTKINKDNISQKPEGKLDFETVLSEEQIVLAHHNMRYLKCLTHFLQGEVLCQQSSARK